MDKIFLFLLALALLGGAWVPSANTALANKAGGAKTRLPHSLKQDKKHDEQQEQQEASRLA